jgi:hypothetical protein
MLCLVGQSLLSGSTSTTPKPVKPCVALQAWAHAYVHAPLTLDEFARFDRPHRVALFSEISPAARAGMMREQLRRLVQRSDLTEAQRALIVEAIPLTTPALYEDDPVARKTFDTYWARASKVFTPLPQARDWFQIGGRVQTTSPALSTNEDGICRCYTADPWPDCLDSLCDAAACQFRTGCGWGGSHFCNGLCITS